MLYFDTSLKAIHNPASDSPFPLQLCMLYFDTSLKAIHNLKIVELKRIMNVYAIF